MWVTLAKVVASITLDWAWPKILSWSSNFFTSMSEKKAFNSSKDRIEKLNGKVKDMIEKASLATATREERRRAAIENARTSITDK
jgi:hypothetical protein